MRYFEDFTIGLELPLGPYRVSREEIVAFAAEFDPQPFHLDEAAASRTLLGGLAASGWHSCAIFMRMICDAFILDSSSMGAPGVDRVKWLRPVRPGDVLTGVSRVVDVRVSNKRPEMGFVRLHHEVRNQTSDLVMSMENPMMLKRREAARA